MTSLERKLLHRVQCLCKRIEDLEVLVGDLEGGTELPLFTEGSVLFAAPDGSITEDNNSFFWDNTSNRLGIGTNIPDVSLHVEGYVKLRPDNIILYGTPPIDFAQTWNVASTITGFKMEITDTLSNAASLLMDLSVGAVSSFSVRKDGRITTAETLAFTNNLSQQTTPTGFLTLSGAMNGTVQYSTVGNLQTALGIGAGALTAGYVAYGTGSGITGEAELFYDSTNNRLGLSTVTPSSKIDITTNALGVTQTTTSGLALVNTTAATIGVQQISPAIRWSGFGFATASGTPSQAVEFRAHVLPIQGSAAPTGNLVFSSGINGSFTDSFTFGSGGVFTSPSIVSIQLTGTSAGRMSITSVFGMALTVPNTNGLYIGFASADVGAEAKVKIVADNAGAAAVNGVLSMTQTWTDITANPTAVKLNITNTASAASSLLMDLQVGGVSQFKVDKVGAVTTAGALTITAGDISLTTAYKLKWGSTYILFDSTPNNYGLLYYALGSDSTSNYTRGHQFSVSGATSAAGANPFVHQITGNTGTFSSGTRNWTISSITYTINNSGTYVGNVTGIKLNATETSLTGTTHNLMDLQTGGTSKFKVSNTGKITTTNTVSLISTGAAATAGTATLVGGTVTVNTTAMTATAILNYNRKTNGGTPGANITYTQVDGTSFTITSDNALDTSVIVWNIIETY